MKTVTHAQQQYIWDEEHKQPYVLQQMDSQEPSSGVVLFYEWLKNNNKLPIQKSIELGCGKGRNGIWLAKQLIDMTGIDFSSVAIQEAEKRAKRQQVEQKTHFLFHDATTTWPFVTEGFDISIDCFATTDIETLQGRKFAVTEMVRVTKSKGYILVYVMSNDDEFHKSMLSKSPAKETNAFLHPTTGKFEKIFTREEILELYNGLILRAEKRVPKTATFFGKEYQCNHHWMIFQKV